MRIAILEDDVPLSMQLADIVGSAGYGSFSFQTGQALMKFLRQETVDMLLLDWNLPDVSGVEVIGWIAKALETSPLILMITARSAEEDVVAAFQAGADDYVTKPVQPAALLARMEALFRRTRQEPDKDGVERFGGYRFDMRLGEIRLNDETVAMTGKEFSLALMLFRNLNRSMSRSYLLESIWGHGATLQTRTLDTHISKIRAKLKLGAENGFRLIPLYGFGYRLETIS